MAVKAEVAHDVRVENTGLAVPTKPSGTGAAETQERSGQRRDGGTGSVLFSQPRDGLIPNHLGEEPAVPPGTPRRPDKPITQVRKAAGDIEIIINDDTGIDGTTGNDPGQESQSTAGAPGAPADIPLRENRGDGAPPLDESRSETAGDDPPNYFPPGYKESMAAIDTAEAEENRRLREEDADQDERAASIQQFAQQRGALRREADRYLREELAPPLSEEPDENERQTVTEEIEGESRQVVSAFTPDEVEAIDRVRGLLDRPVGTEGPDDEGGLFQIGGRASGVEREIRWQAAVTFPTGTVSGRKPSLTDRRRSVEGILELARLAQTYLDPLREGEDVAYRPDTEAALRAIEALPQRLHRFGTETTTTQDHPTEDRAQDHSREGFREGKRRREKERKDRHQQAAELSAAAFVAGDEQARTQAAESLLALMTTAGMNLGNAYDTLSSNNPDQAQALASILYDQIAGNITPRIHFNNLVWLRANLPPDADTSEIDAALHQFLRKPGFADALQTATAWAEERTTSRIGSLAGTMQAFEAGALEHADEIPLGEILQNNVRPGQSVSAEDLSRFSVQPVTAETVVPSSGDQEKYAMQTNAKAAQASGGTQFTFTGDGPMGLVLFYDDIPQAAVNFDVEGNTVVIRQMQEVQQYQRTDEGRTHEVQQQPEALQNIDFSGAAIDLVAQYANQIGLPLQPEGQELVETIVQVRDATAAERKGLQQDADGNWVTYLHDLIPNPASGNPGNQEATNPAADNPGGPGRGERNGEGTEGNGEGLSDERYGELLMRVNSLAKLMVFAAMETDVPYTGTSLETHIASLQNIPPGWRINGKTLADYCRRSFYNAGLVDIVEAEGQATQFIKRQNQMTDYAHALAGELGIHAEEGGDILINDFFGYSSPGAALRLKIYKELLQTQTGETVSSLDLQDILGVNRNSLNKMLQTLAGNQIITMDSVPANTPFATFQFDQTKRDIRPEAYRQQRTATDQILAAAASVEGEITADKVTAALRALPEGQVSENAIALVPPVLADLAKQDILIRTGRAYREGNEISLTATQHARLTELVTILEHVQSGHLDDGRETAEAIVASKDRFTRLMAIARGKSHVETSQPTEVTRELIRAIAQGQPEVTVRSILETLRDSYGITYSDTTIHTELDQLTASGELAVTTRGTAKYYASVEGQGQVSEGLGPEGIGASIQIDLSPPGYRDLISAVEQARADRLSDEPDEALRAEINTFFDQQVLRVMVQEIQNVQQYIGTEFLNQFNEEPPSDQWVLTTEEISRQTRQIEARFTADEFAEIETAREALRILGAARNRTAITNAVMESASQFPRAKLSAANIERSLEYRPGAVAGMLLTAQAAQIALELMERRGELDPGDEKTEQLRILAQLPSKLHRTIPEAVEEQPAAPVEQAPVQAEAERPVVRPAEQQVVYEATPAGVPETAEAEEDTRPQFILSGNEIILGNTRTNISANDVNMMEALMTSDTPMSASEIASAMEEITEQTEISSRPIGRNLTQLASYLSSQFGYDVILINAPSSHKAAVTYQLNPAFRFEGLPEEAIEEREANPYYQRVSDVPQRFSQEREDVATTITIRTNHRLVNAQGQELRIAEGNPLFLFNILMNNTEPLTIDQIRMQGFETTDPDPARRCRRAMGRLRENMASFIPDTEVILRIETEEGVKFALNPAVRLVDQREEYAQQRSVAETRRSQARAAARRQRRAEQTSAEAERREAVEQARARNPYYQQLSEIPPSRSEEHPETAYEVTIADDQLMQNSQGAGISLREGSLFIVNVLMNSSEPLTIEQIAAHGFVTQAADPERRLRETMRDLRTRFSTFSPDISIIQRIETDGRIVFSINPTVRFIDRREEFAAQRRAAEQERVAAAVQREERPTREPTGREQANAEQREEQLALTSSAFTAVIDARRGLEEEHPTLGHTLNLYVAHETGIPIAVVRDLLAIDLASEKLDINLRPRQFPEVSDMNSYRTAVFDRLDRAIAAAELEPQEKLIFGMHLGLPPSMNTYRSLTWSSREIPYERFYLWTQSRRDDRGRALQTIKEGLFPNTSVDGMRAIFNRAKDKVKAELIAQGLA